MRQRHSISFRLTLAFLVGVLVCAGTSARGNLILVDFGPNNDDDGRATSSPDTNGNYWNSWRPTTGGANIPIGTTSSTLVDTGNLSTGIALEVTSIFTGSNGIVNGGLRAPDGPSAALLGDFAIETATEDYFYDSGSGAFKLNNLDPTKTYNFRFFGTRNSSQTRITQYTVTGSSNPLSGSLTTSGTNIGSNGVYSGNDDTIVSIAGVRPDVNNEILIDVTRTAGDFAYLGIMEVAVLVPEPTTALGLLVLLGAAGFRRRRRAVG